jgi:recombination protein RecR
MSHSEIDELIRLFAKLPGLGPRSARRAVLQMLRHKEQVMTPLASAISRAMDNVRTCTNCGNLDTRDPCSICSDAKRDPSVICVVEELADLWAIERCNLFRGTYHVLGGTLSAMDDRGPSQLNIESLISRAGGEPSSSERVIFQGCPVQRTRHSVIIAVKSRA